MNITTELLEHYLRATGWERDSRLFWCNGAWEIGTFAGMSEHDISHAVVRLDQVPLSVPRGTHAFRLGLCAAAERLLSLRREHTNRAGVDPVNNAVCIVTLSNAASLLELAGLAYAAWESARPT